MVVKYFDSVDSNLVLSTAVSMSCLGLVMGGIWVTSTLGPSLLIVLAASDRLWNASLPLLSLLPLLPLSALHDDYDVLVFDGVAVISVVEECQGLLCCVHSVHD